MGYAFAFTDLIQYGQTYYNEIYRTTADRKASKEKRDKPEYRTNSLRRLIRIAGKYFGGG